MGKDEPKNKMHTGAQRRELNRKIYDFKYIKAKSIDDSCLYCGDIAEVWDHVPPISRAYQYTGTFVLVPACRSCNAYLYSHALLTLPSRREHIRQKLYKLKDYKIPDWYKSELCEIKGYIKKYVKKGLCVQRNIRERILYISENIGETFQDYIYEDYEKPVMIVSKKEENDVSI